MDCGDETIAKPQLVLDIPFKSAIDANIVKNALSVDKEPPRSTSVRSVEVRGNVVHATFTAETAQQLRIAVNSFMDLLILASKTIDQFRRT